MLILNPLRHSCQHVNQTLTRATPSSIRNASPARFCYHINCFNNTLYFQQPVTFVKEFNDDDVAQILIDTLEKNIKEIHKRFKFPKMMIMTMHDKWVCDNFTLCHICNEQLGKARVRDHYHLSSKLELLLMKYAT